MRNIYPLTAILFSGLCFPTFLPAQCPQVLDAGPDIYLCSPTLPALVQLNGTTGAVYLGHSWTPFSVLSDPYSLSPIAAITKTTTFVLNGKVAGSNLVFNGDFEMGNTGFTSDFTYSPGNLMSASTYDVLSDPSADNDLFEACSDHTGGGNMLAAMGSPTPFEYLWCQTVSVKPNTEYVLSYWAARLNGPTNSVVTGWVNSDQVTPYTHLTGSPCEWTYITGGWYSGNATTADICLRTSKSVGKGLGVDDILFAEVCDQKDSMTVYVVNVIADVAASSQFIPCNNNNLALSAAGSTTGPFITYQWTTANGHIVSGSNTMNPVINTTGEYTLTVIFDDGNGVCSDEATVVVEENNTLQAWVDPPPLIGCGSATVNLVGHANQPGTIKYQWSADAGGHIVSGANAFNPVVDQAGTYYLTITNASTGCTAETSVDVEATMTPPVANATAGPINCLHLQASLSGAGSSTGPNIHYAWTTANGHIVSGQNGVNAAADSAGIYILTVTNIQSNCAMRDTVIVNANTTAPQAGIQPHGIFDCIADSLTLSAVVSPAQAIPQWSATNGGQIAAGADSLKAVVTAPGIYTLMVTNPANGCTAVLHDTLGQSVATPIAAVQAAGPITCLHPSLTLSADSSSTGSNFTYTWMASAGGNILSGANTLTPVVNAPGDYTLLVTNSDNGCTATAALVVTADTNAVIAIANAAQSLTCTTQLVTLNAIGSSAGPGLQYLWTTTDGHIISGSDGPAPLVDAPGTYRLLISNPASGCTATDLAEVLQNTSPPQLKIAPPGALTCAVQALLLQGENASSGQATYQWTALNGGHIVSGAETLTPLVDATGSYALQATDLTNGCTAQLTISVAADQGAPGASLSFSGILNCHASTVILSSSSAADPDLLAHSWTPPGGPLVQTGAVPQLQAGQPGTYLVVVSNTQNGCTSSATATLVARLPVSASVTGLPVISCFGATDGYLNTTVGGGDGQFQYTWNTGAKTAQLTQLAAGTYTVTVSDGEDCTTTASATIGQPPALTANYTTTVPSAPNLADGTASAQAAGGTPPYAYHWSTGGLTPVITGLAAGFYTVTIIDNRGCSIEHTVEITKVNCALQASFSVVQPSCYGQSNGQATVSLNNAAAPLTYAWASGATTASAGNLPAGTQDVTVTDANGCQFAGNVTLSDPPLLTLAVDQVFNTTCPGTAEGAATVIAGGGTGATSISWSNGQHGASAINLLAGNYSATVTDTKGCTASVNLAIQAIDQEPPVIQATPATVSLGPSGTVTLTLANLGASMTDNCGLAGFHIQPATFDCSDLGPHIVILSAFDQSGNSSSVPVQVNIIDNLPPQISCPENILECFEDRVVTYLAPVATDNCLSLGGHFDLLAGLPSGSAFPEGTTVNTFSFTDASGNAGACSFTVTIRSPLLVVFDGVTPTQTQQSFGGIQMTVSGGQPGYTFAWTRDGQVVAQTEDLTHAPAGIYTLLVTDAFGCTVEAGPYEIPELVGTDTPNWIEAIQVRPNPTDGLVRVSLPARAATETVYGSVTDAMGRTIIRPQILSGKSWDIDLSGQAEGLYLLLIRAENLRQKSWRILLLR